VFEQDWPITMVGLDVTEQVTLSRAERNALAKHTSAEAELLQEVTRHIFDVHAFESMSLHDPLALLVAIEPDLVTTLEKDVHVEARGEHTLGQTVVDFRRGATTAKRRTRVCTEVDVKRARELFFTTLGF
jgi:purine nucleosidase